MSAAPRVSVVIATYNRAERLAQAIESVLQQSFRDLEIIVCDDGSTDDTSQRIGALKGPIRHLRLAHSGRQAAVRNSGLREARGELIAFLDDDDCWEPEKLARQVAFLDAHPEIGIGHTWFSIVEADGTIHTPTPAPWQTASGTMLDRLLRGFFIHLSTAVVRRTLLDEVGGFDERRLACDDYDLWLRLSPIARAACIPEPLVRIGRGTDNISTTRDRPVIYDVTIGMLEEWLAGGRLRPRQRLRCRAAISNLHVSAARLALEAGDRPRERRHTVAALGRNPLNRRAWTTFGRHLLPGS